MADSSLHHMADENTSKDIVDVSSTATGKSKRPSSVRIDSKQSSKRSSASNHNSNHIYMIANLLLCGYHIELKSIWQQIGQAASL